jgi:hypothetical protein
MCTKQIVSFKHKCDQVKHSESNLAPVTRGETECVRKRPQSELSQPSIAAKLKRMTQILSDRVYKTIIFCVLDDNCLKVITTVPFSNSTISRRVEHVSCNIECELINYNIRVRV